MIFTNGFSACARWLAWRLAALSIAALGCTPAASFPRSEPLPQLTCPWGGGPAWTAIGSSHFVLKTDLPAAEGKQIAAVMEILHAALLTAMDAPASDSVAPIEIVLFHHAEDFRAVMGNRQLRGRFYARLPGDVELDPVIVSFGKLTYGTRSTLVHELTHQILRRRTARVPWWLDEGLAGLFSPLWVREPEKGVAVVGSPPLDVDFWDGSDARWDTELPTPKLWLPRGHAPSFDELVNADRLMVEASGRVEAYYAAAWKLVHVLRGHANASYAPRFWTMMSSLMSGTAGQEAFTKAYGDIPITEIAEAYERFLLDHEEHSGTVEFDVPTNLDFAESSLSDADVHALWARLLVQSEGAIRSAAQELEIGEREHPASLPLAYARTSITLRTGSAGSASGDIERLLGSEPGNPRYMLLALLDAESAWRAEKDPAARDQKRERLVKVADALLRKATSPAQQSLTATVLMELGRPDEALELSEKSSKTDPSCGLCFTNRAMLLLSAGSAAKARIAAEKALTLTPDGDSTALVQELLGRIDNELARAIPPTKSPSPGSGAASGSGDKAHE